MAESISTEGRQVVLHFDGTREIEGLSLTQDFKYGIKVGSAQIKLDMKLLANSWQEVLKGVLQKMSISMLGVRDDF